MIINVKLGKELVVMSKNKVGVLSQVASALADHGINITAISAQSAGGVGLMNFVVDDHLRASDLLRKKKFQVHDSEIILLEVQDKPGALKRLTKRLAAKKIDILNVYGSAPATYGPCTLVLSTDHNQHALVTLKQAM
ncbi:MAG: hypothetical protein COV74_04350 [Candidatus Omnitrophica bacterium CG11_big_fil_rev_8_21_14_0_20_45_26]|uniref:ACT domain-containing protein n=1 Tax=Candidatus Abzuiibacterium crystallinum TaxID=1974748 RepID=A0A2H0LQ06_9BACT|nr:MAG: hypothetical protein COV74_04350 [Candidatus Omnitrophica bacterium CG11_big_fil_rev_8_21_14_0_20_45_26]PIW64260.1 MAG: hypothetical protein COW12_06870 [Candidatus Omnitrophica bacterium CG12_big_fil_rev_8_21_14_0_65_45_16]